jgi:hypothetical protein
MLVDGVGQQALQRIQAGRIVIDEEDFRDRHGGLDG